MSVFLPYATMFKLRPRVPGPRVEEYCLEEHAEPTKVVALPPGNRVECVACQAEFPLHDLLSHELEELGPCPSCSVTAGRYWARKPHREVPTEKEQRNE